MHIEGSALLQEWIILPAMTTNSPKTPYTHSLKVSDLNVHQPNPFEIVLPAKQRKEMAATLEIIEIRKIRFSGSISATGQKDWELRAKLGATVVQSCVLTLEPVVTRFDVLVARDFVPSLESAYKTPTEEDEEEIEIPENENIEVLGQEIGLGAILIEAMALALPLYPKVENASLDQATFSADGVTPMQDEDTRAFAGLAGLRDKMKNND